MKKRVIFQIRLSKRWIAGSQEAVSMLVHYLYSLYIFLGLADPSTDFGWMIGTEVNTEVPYLLLFEILFDDEEEEFLDTGFDTENLLQPEDESLDQGLSEDDLSPDIYPS